MNLEKRFIEVSKFLKQHLILVDTEALALAGTIPAPYQEWLDEINALTTLEKVELENITDTSKITKTEYISYLNQIKELSQIPKRQLEQTPIDKELGKKISKKKKHEISLISQFLKGKTFSRIVDVGSGAGHLSSILIANGAKESLCIDSSSDYQEIGRAKLARYAPEILEKITFKNTYISHAQDIQLEKDNLLIGLHSCGDLSVKLIESLVKTKLGSLLSYGCCYHKLTEKNINISSIGKSENIGLNEFALTMAAKGYKPQTLESFQQKERVKTFRYSIHFINSRLLGEGFTTLGNARKQDYLGRFEDYVKKYSPSTLDRMSEQAVIDFYHSKENSSEIENLISLGIIRSQIARIVEIYIILDRALYLQENGFRVEVEETFDRSLSPRNLSLLAQSL